MGDDTIIVGGGVAGASAAFWLARSEGRRGAVTLLEAGQRLGAQSSGRSAAILRPAIDDAVAREWALETRALLERPPSDLAARPLLDPVGLVIAAGREGAAPAWAEPLEARGIAIRRPAEEVAPWFRPRAASAWWLPSAGRVAAHALVQALVLASERAGARTITGARVARILTDGSRVSGVELEGGERLAAARVVLAAGAWSRELGRDVGCDVPLASNVRHLFVTAPLDGFDARAPIVWDDEAGLYARAYDGGLLFCACDESPAEADEVAPRYRCDADVERRAAELLASLAPIAAAAPIARRWCGLRDATPDGRPLVGPDPRLAGLAWCAGFGGHGFSIGLAAGRALARALDGAVGEEGASEASSADPTRFAREGERPVDDAETAPARRRELAETAPGSARSRARALG